REHDPGQPLEEARVRPLEEVADEREERLLPLDLAGVDAADGQDDRTAELVGGLGGPDPLRRENEDGEVTPFRARPRRLEGKPPVPSGSQGLDKGHDLGMAGSAEESGGFGLGKGLWRSDGAHVNEIPVFRLPYRAR